MVDDNHRRKPSKFVRKILLKEKIQKNLRHFFPHIYNKIMLKDFPVNIQLETTALCNATCIMCPHSFYGKNLMPHDQMSDELFSKIVTELKKYKINSILLFFYGEPLIDKKLEDRIMTLRNELPNIRMEVHTNGSLLNEERSKKLVNSGLNKIYFSFEAITKEVYEHIMKLDFEDTRKKVEYFLSLERPENLEAWIGMIKHDLITDEEEQKYIDHWNKFNVKLHIQNYANTLGGGLTDTKIARIDNDNNGKKLVGCNQDRQSKWVHITASGNVVICCNDYNHKYILGNVKNQSIMEIWNSEAYKILRKKVEGKIEEDNFICLTCETAQFN